eukprot:GDKH01024661.1.p2 GENE.GDKH01024661.1~~GDKH01024661.1.p2  ORF type:complete len:160 (-),score=17.01 GDKH01024661.1:340-819(-)
MSVVPAVAHAADNLTVRLRPKNGTYLRYDQWFSPQWQLAYRTAKHVPRHGGKLYWAIRERSIVYRIMFRAWHQKLNDWNRDGSRLAATQTPRAGYLRNSVEWHYYLDTEDWQHIGSRLIKLFQYKVLFYMFNFLWVFTALGGAYGNGKFNVFSKWRKQD